MVSGVIDLAAYRRRKARTPHFDPQPAQPWPHWTLPCAHCGKPLGEGMQLLIGAAAYHGRKGSCRNAALRWLSAQEQEYAENARRAGVYSHGGTEPFPEHQGLARFMAQCSFPPRPEAETGA